MQIDKLDATKKAAVVATALGVTVSAPYLAVYVLPFIAPVIKDIAKAGLDVLPDITANALWELKDSFKSDRENKHLTRLLAKAYSQAIEDFLEQTEDNSDYEQFGRFLTIALPKIKVHIDEHLATNKEKDLAKLFPNEDSQEQIIADDKLKLPFYRRLFLKKDKEYEKVDKGLLANMTAEKFILANSENAGKATEIIVEEVGITLKRWFWQVDAKLANEYYFLEVTDELVFKKIAELIPLKIKRLLNETEFQESWKSFQRSHMQAILHQVNNNQNGLSEDDRKLLRPLGEALGKLSKNEELLENLTNSTLNILKVVGESEENVKNKIEEERQKLEKWLSPQLDEISDEIKGLHDKFDEQLNQRTKTIKFNTVLVPNINHRIYGRKEELAELDRFLKEESRHGAIVGLTCLGKTSLVRKYLYKNYDVKNNVSKIPEVFTDVLYIDCQQVLDFEKLLNQFNVFMRTALVFDVDEKAEFWRSEVFSQFGERKILLVIDNFENWIEDGSYKNDDVRDFVKTFLQDSGNARAMFLSWFNPHKETEFAIRVQNLTEIEKSLSDGLKSKDAIKLVQNESKKYQGENSLVDLDEVSDAELENFFIEVNHNPQSIQSMVHFIGRKQCTFAEFLSIYQESFDELERDEEDLKDKRGDLDRSAKAMLNLQINLLNEKTKEILLHTAFYGKDVPHDILVWDDKDNLDKINRLVNDHLLIRTINRKDTKPLRLYNIHNSIRVATKDALQNFKNDYQNYLTNLAYQMYDMCYETVYNKLYYKQLALSESWYLLEDYLIEDRKLIDREFSRDSADLYNALALPGIIETESDYLTNDQKDKFLVKSVRIYQDFIDKYKDNKSRKKDVARVHNNLGNLLKNHLEKYEEAEEQYRLAIEKDENEAAAHYNLALLLVNHLGKYEEAEEQYRLAIEKDENNAAAHYNLAVLLMNQFEKYEESEEQFRIAIKKDENDADAYGGLAVLKAGTVGEDAKDEILDNLEKCLSLNPNHKDWARGNLVFEFLRDDERFKELVGDEED